MGIEFDAINKYILITSPTTDLAALQIYNATMDWCDDQPTMGYTVPMKAIGKAPLGGGVYTDSIFILQDGWKIKFWSGTYQATITGTLITDDESERTVPPDSGNVEVVFQVSSQATIIPDEAEWTQTEKNDLISNIDEIKPKIDAIKPKTDNLPLDPASQGLVEAVKAKTDQLPTNPASEDSVQTVSQEIATHDIDIKGEPLENHTWINHQASLLEIREVLDELKVSQKKTGAKFDL